MLHRPGGDRQDQRADSRADQDPDGPGRERDRLVGQGVEQGGGGLEDEGLLLFAAHVLDRVERRDREPQQAEEQLTELGPRQAAGGRGLRGGDVGGDLVLEGQERDRGGKRGGGDRCRHLRLQTASAGTTWRRRCRQDWHSTYWT
ncbi:MAG: hypothetical protein ACK559_25130, partial [bacterium]